MVRARKKLPRELIRCPLCKRRKFFARFMDLNQHLNKVHNFDYEVDLQTETKLKPTFSWKLRTKLKQAIQI